MASLLALPAGAASDEDLAREDRIRELERKVEILAEELERTRTELAVPEEPKLESSYGLGPAASKVYAAARGLSLGGYAEGRYTALVKDKGDRNNTIDALRFVLYAGYKFTDWLVFNSEVELEHASTGESGSVSLEFATLDFLLADWANPRIGLLLIPMGFLNEIHEPPFYFGTHRPDVERRIIPSTWRENGLGLFGSFFGDQFEYKLYGVNGFDASGFDEAGLRGGRQKGSKALADDFAFVGRLDWTPLPGLLLGGSGYVGNSGQNQTDGTTGLDLPDALTTIVEAHAQFRWRGLHLRGLATRSTVDDAGALNVAIGNAPGGTGVAEEMDVRRLRGDRLRAVAVDLARLRDDARALLPLRVDRHPADRADRLRAGRDEAQPDPHAGSVLQADPQRRAQGRLSQRLSGGGDAGRRGQPGDRTCLLGFRRS
jgi:hypothetical protein